MDKKRNTIQKQLVFAAVNELGCHATAEQIYKSVAAKHPSISKGTVYRNLNQLAEDGEILRVNGIDDSDHFDHNCHNHYHFICERCNFVFDVDMDYQSDIYDKIMDKNGFCFTSHNISFRGLCPECSGFQT